MESWPEPEAMKGKAEIREMRTQEMQLELLNPAVPEASYI